MLDEPVALASVKEENINSPGGEAAINAAIGAAAAVAVSALQGRPF
jgi:hypothetical protein